MTQKAEAISRPDAPPCEHTVGVEKKRRKDQPRPWFDRECLELKRLMNLARGANVTAWPLPSPWNVRFQKLKDAIKTERLKAVPDRDGREKWALVCLSDVSVFIEEYGAGDKWAWLQDFCQRWAKEGDHRLPDPKAAKASKVFSVFSEAKVTKWYKERVADWKDGDPIPSREDDLVAARDEFSDFTVSRDFMRELRSQYAPSSKKGRRPTFPT